MKPSFVERKTIALMLYRKHSGTLFRKTIACIMWLSMILPIARVWAAEAPKDKDFIMHHIKDSHEWHFATIGQQHIALPLPVIIYSPDRGVELFSSECFMDKQHQRVPYKGYMLGEDDKIVALETDRVFYDLSITKNVAAMLVSVLLLLCIFVTAAHRYRRSPQSVPRGLWALLELLICFVKDEIAVPNIGESHYKRFVPYLLSIFFFIWINNILGLMPGAANVTGNISVTLVLALFTFVMTNLNGNRHYWQHVFNTPGVPRWLTPLMIPVELLGLFTKPFALMIRLFANITAGHIILLSIIGLIFTLRNPWVGIISVPFGTFMFLLKLLVAFLQAYIFTLLSAIYLGSAVNNHE